MFPYTVFFILTYQAGKLSNPFNRMSLQGSRALLVAIWMLMLMGFRDQTVAGDTIAYVGNFLHLPIQWTSLGDFWAETREPLFYLLEWACQKITSSYTVYLFITSLMLVVGFCRLLKDYSDDMFLSMVVFCTIGCMYFCMAGLRQAIAIGATMIAFKFANERKLLLFSLWCFIAYEFHNSAIVFAFAYLFINWEAGWKAWVGVLVFVALGIARSEWVMQVSGYFTTREYTMAEEGLNHTMFFIQLMIITFCYLYAKKLGKENFEHDFNSFMILSFAGLCFQALTPIKGEFFRVSLYFSLYSSLAVPRVLAKMESRDRAVMRPAMILCFLTYFYMFGAPRSYLTCF